MASKKTKENKAKTPKADKATTERNAAASEKGRRDSVRANPANRSVTLGAKTPAEAQSAAEAAAHKAYGVTPTKEQHRAGGLFMPDSFYEAPVEHGTRAKPSKAK